MYELTPQAIVDQLDKHIIGQDAAKRAVAVALRNRWRRAQLPPEMRTEITPKNILMIGPTGVGKTEIARRLARLSGAPFIKIEATKFTEVGYVGRDVESIVRDLVDAAMTLAREEAMAAVRGEAEEVAEERILDKLLPGPAHGEPKDPRSETRQHFRKMFREGKLDDREIDIEIATPGMGVEIMTPPGMEEMTRQLQGMFQNLGNQRKQSRRVKVKEAYRLVCDEEAARLVNDDDLRTAAVENVEQNGIVFLDELDKITSRSEAVGADVSREGVQRDLLPLVEGCTVTTKYGSIKTDHILFIASGAFHLAKPSDLIPELQGRLPNRVELDPLGEQDFIRILTEPQASLTEQYQALLGTEGVVVTFHDDGIARIAAIAQQVNETSENIGARRLHTVMERLLEALSFTAPSLHGQTVTIDADYVDQHLGELIRDDDLARYIL